MRPARTIALPAIRRDPDGRQVCRWCGAAIPSMRRSWCSQACVDQYGVRAWPAHARRMVERRDHGICCLCGVDCLAWKRAYEVERERLRGILRAVPAGDHDLYDRYRDESDLVRTRWQALRLPPHTWEADHIVPVVDGGGGCGLEGLRTLCLACHRRQTAALRARLALGRRTA